MPDEDIKLPYVVQPKKIRQYFNKIAEVETPPRFTINFLEDVMLFKSNNDRNLIPLLKRMGFLQDNGNPTQLYSDYKITDLSKTTVAKGIRTAYSEIHRRKKNFDTLNEEATKSYVKSITHLGDNSSVLPLIVKTLMNLKEIADFTHSDVQIPPDQEVTLAKETTETTQSLDSQLPFKLNYTISINLPNSTNQETYDMIFESIKKILLTK